MSEQVIWEGVCDQYESYKTTVRLESGKVWLRQESSRVSYANDIVVMEPSEAIDIAFAILKDLAPTIHETLEKINAES